MATMNENSESMLSSFRDGPENKHQPKSGWSLFHLFDWNKRLSLFPHKLLTAERHKNEKQQQQQEEKLAMAKLFSIADENRSGLSSDSLASANEDITKKMKKPGLVARLMGLESMPVLDPLLQKMGHLVQHASHKNEFFKRSKKLKHFIINDKVDESKHSLICKASSFSSKQEVRFLSVFSPSKTHKKLASPTKCPLGAKKSVKLIEAAVKILEPGMKSSATRELLKECEMDKQAKRKAGIPKNNISSRSFVNVEQDTQRNRHTLEAGKNKKSGRVFMPSSAPSIKGQAIAENVKSSQKFPTSLKPNVIKGQFSSSTMAATKEKPKPVMASFRPKNTANQSRKARHLESVSKKTPVSKLDRGSSKDCSLGCSQTDSGRQECILKGGKVSGGRVMAVDLSSEISSAEDSKSHLSPISVMEPPFCDESCTSPDTLEPIDGPVELIDGIELYIDEQDLQQQKHALDLTLLTSLESKLVDQGWSFPVIKKLEEEVDVEQSHEGIAYQNRMLILDCVNEILSSKNGICIKALVFGDTPFLERVIWKQIQEWKAMADERLMLEEMVKKETMKGWETLGEKVDVLVTDMVLDLLEWLIDELAFGIVNELTHKVRL